MPRAGETSVTFVTLAVAEAARPEPAWDLITDANVGPSWSRLIRWATGVFALKNAAQFFAIVAVAPELAAEVDGLAAEAEADEDGAELGLELAPEPELLLLPEQAAMPAPSAHTSRVCWRTLGATMQLVSNFSPPAATRRPPVHDTQVRHPATSWPHAQRMMRGNVPADQNRKETQTDASGPESPAPPASAGAGYEPDARYTFANERTFLAWMRTALGLVAAGLAIIQLLPPFHGIRWGRHALGVPLIVLGAVVAVRSYAEWSANQRGLRRGEPPRHSWLPLLLAVVIALVALTAATLTLTSS